MAFDVNRLAAALKAAKLAAKANGSGSMSFEDQMEAAAQAEAQAFIDEIKAGSYDLDPLTFNASNSAGPVVLVSGKAIAS